MAKKQFKTESKRILDLMVHSIYTHREIFLRELISNASDAIDKLYFRSLTDPSVGMSREDFAIDLTADKDARVLTIRDNGCGMTKEELENNLGVIARSGTLDFKKNNELGDDIDIIGQFGVGFYSAFMVAKKITVESRAFGVDEAWQWESTGEDGYTITPCEKADAGTCITLVLKDNEGEDNYDEYLSEYRISSLVKKYSDYIRYPIRLDMPRSRKKEGTENDWETYTENTVLNSMIPVWRKGKDELEDGEYERFYQEKFHDMEAPLKTIHTKVEGSVTYTALLYIPKKPPFDFYSKEYHKGLQLYTNGVMIMDNCEDLLPDYFGFVKGLVDSADLSLNISREMLQHDRQLKVIAANLQKKIRAELLKMQKEERETYEEFYNSFGLTLKYGVYTGYGQNKQTLQDLLMFHSMKQNKLVTLQEYTDAMPQEQTEIYYACGTSVEQITRLPQLERIADKGYDVLCLTQDVDEFALKMIETFAEKPFRSAADSSLALESDEEKAKVEEKTEAGKEMLSALQEALGDKVDEVKLSSRLKSNPVCLTSEGDLTLDMEKVLNAMPMEQKVKAKRVLEINAEHPIFDTLCAAAGDRDKLAKYAQLLYTQAMLIEGFPVEDPVAYSNLVCELMSQQK
ncbi:MAG: molecular chaperone HtpG [Eubacteriales bacterium]|nr:molecular chaperone HtpG [Eubacteriales bacterium]